MSFVDELEIELKECMDEILKIIEDDPKELKWFQESWEREKRIIEELRDIEKQRIEDEKKYGPLIVPQDLSFRQKMYGFSQEDIDHICEGKQSDTVAGQEYVVQRSK